MPRKPDAKSRSPLVLRVKPEWEIQVRAFKELCGRNGIEYSKELFERGVLGFLRDHNWPPGNSQTRMKDFVQTQLKECFFCKKPNKVLFRVEYISGLIAPTCRDCLDEKKRKGRSSTVKRVIGRWE
jgi:hypothetical protein